MVTHRNLRLAEQEAKAVVCGLGQARNLKKTFVARILVQDRSINQKIPVKNPDMVGMDIVVASV